MNTKLNLNRSDLAINGGSPVRTKDWLDNFTLGEEEKQAAIKAIESGYLSLFEGSYKPDPPFSFYGGPYVQELEKRWAEYYGAKFAVSMNSATSGLYAAVGALGIGYGDEVIVSPYTMTACALAPIIYGAIPIFADVDLKTGCLDVNSIEEKITSRTKAILLVHQFGIPADMQSIMTIAKEYNLKVIEDCAQAHGAKYKGQYVGTFGDIGVFSLNVNKTIQTGEGAVIITNDEELFYRLALIRNHGENVVGPSGYKNITNILGFNYRLTEIQAAMAIEQIKKLDRLNKIRLEFVDMLKEELKNYEFIEVLGNHLDSSSLATYYVFPFRLLNFSGDERENFVNVLNKEGAIFYKGYVRPLYLQPIYQTKDAFKFGYPFSAPENQEIKINYYLGSCPNAEKLHFNELVINEHIRYPHKKEDIKDLIKIFKKVCNG